MSLAASESCEESRVQPPGASRRALLYSLHGRRAARGAAAAAAHWPEPLERWSETSISRALPIGPARCPLSAAYATSRSSLTIW